MKILLGSNSPRRNELLTQMDIDFTKVKIDCEEDFDAAMDAAEVPVFLSQKKSNAYPDLGHNELLITADTVVVNGNIILNKPANANEAREMLRSLSNTSHEVITGVTLRSLDKSVSFSNTTKVWVDTLSEDDVEYYVSKYKPYDKAGAYGIQEWFGLTQVKKIEGCFYNVVGLPCNHLFKRLKNNYNAI